MRYYNDSLTLSSFILERQKRMQQKSEGDSERKDEEDWHLKDVVFVEEVKTLPLGKVIKVDGCYVAVKFFAKDLKEKEKENKEKDYNSDSTAEEPTKLLADCRLLRKDELVVSFSITVIIFPNFNSKNNFM